MDYSNIREVKEIDTQEEVTRYLGDRNDDWILLAVATGQDKEGKPIFRYSIGKRRNIFREFVELKEKDKAQSGNEDSSALPF